MLKIIDLTDAKELNVKDMDSIRGGFLQFASITQDKSLPDSSDWPISYSISTKPIKNNYDSNVFALIGSDAIG